MWEGESILDVELNGSTAGYIALAAKARESTVIASKWPNIIAGAGSVKSSAGTKISQPACRNLKTLSIKISTS